VNFEQIDYDAQANFVIERVFERGDVEDIRQCRRYYGDEKLMTLPFIEWHKQKYPSQRLAISIPNAFSCFADAEESETPVSFKNQIWEQIKKSISKAVSDYLR
jgi:hypothetical protein